MSQSPSDYFELRARHSTVSREIRGGLTTFLTMAYILVANASILVKAGIPHESVIACTALAAGVCSILMGLLANFPIALAAGMGLNAMVALQVTPMAGTWQRAMGLVVLDGVVVLLLVLLGLRQAIMRAIPRDLRLATGAGIGLFIAFIGLTHAGLVTRGNPTLVAPGNLRDPNTYTAALIARRFKGALVLGIAATTLLGLLTGVTHAPSSLFSLPKFDILFQADVGYALANLVRFHQPLPTTMTADASGPVGLYPHLLPILLSLIMVDFFDTLGTVTAIAEEAKLIPATPDLGGRVTTTRAGEDPNSAKIPHLRRILLVDSLSASIGGLLGVSSNTSYIESAAGVAEGARTGLHSVVVGLLFLLAIFLAPLASAVPDAATAPALILVGFLMISQLTKINFDAPATAIPAFITLLTIPLTFSIAHGIGYGFIAYCLLHLLTLRPRHVHPLMYATAAAFAAFFLLGRS